jgi:hypothetical protein
MNENRVVAQSSNSAGVKKYRFYCEGCKGTHTVNEGWMFNGDYERPTFTPSILVRSGHYMEGHTGDSCWCTYNAEHPDNPAPFKCGVCHSFVTDGKIQYLSDCTHELAEQTIDLKPID